jgi:hypothetical protein
MPPSSDSSLTNSRNFRVLVQRNRPSGLQFAPEPVDAILVDALKGPYSC